jgi:hypothetical protein
MVTKAGGDAGFFLRWMAQDLFARFPRVIHPQHHQACAAKAILEHIGRSKNLQNDLPVFFPAGDRPPEPRMLDQDLYLGDNLGSYPLSKSRMFLIESASASADHWIFIGYAKSGTPEFPKSEAIARLPHAE